MSTRRERAWEHTVFSQQRQVQLGESDSESAFMYYTHTHKICLHARTCVSHSVILIRIFFYSSIVCVSSNPENGSKHQRQKRNFLHSLLACSHLNIYKHRITLPAPLKHAARVNAPIHAYRHVYMCTCVQMCVPAFVYSARSDKSPRSQHSLDCAMS